MSEKVREREIGKKKRERERDIIKSNDRSQMESLSVS